MRERLRRHFPRSGQPYRLFDSAVAVVAIALLWYVLTVPSPITRGAVAETVLSVASARFWGWVLLGSGVLALVALRIGTPRWLDIGYGSIMLSTGLWTITLFTGALFGYFVGDASWNQTGKVLGQAVMFGVILSNTVASLLRAQPGARCVDCSCEIDQ